MKPIWREPYRSDAKEILRLCLPYMLSYVCDLMVIPTTSIIFMGWVGQAEFNACSIGRVLWDLFGHVSHFGSMFACDTLLSQAFGGNKRYMGTVLQRAVVITVMIILIEWILLINIQYFTGYIEKDRHVAGLINDYLTFAILTTPFEASSILIQKFIINHRVTWPIVMINIIGALINTIAHYLFLYQFHLGVRAPPLAFACAYFGMTLSCIIYVQRSTITEESWHPWTSECLKDWSTYLKLGIPGILVNWMQSLVYGGAVLLSTVFGENAITAQSIVYYIDFFLFLITLAFSVSATMVVGRYLGMQRYDDAKQAVAVVYTTAIIVIFTTMAIGFSFLYWIPYLFHAPSSAIPTTRYLLAIVFVFCGLDFYHLSQAGILKACGKQHLDAMVSFVAYLIIGVPVGCLLILVCKFAMAGYWLALAASLVLTNIVFFFLIRKFLHSNHEELYMLKEADNNEQMALLQDTPPHHRFSGRLLTKLLIFVVLICLFISSAIVRSHYHS